MQIVSDEVELLLGAVVCKFKGHIEEDEWHTESLQVGKLYRDKKTKQLIIPIKTFTVKRCERCGKLLRRMEYRGYPCLSTQVYYDMYGGVEKIVKDGQTITDKKMTNKLINACLKQEKKRS